MNRGEFVGYVESRAEELQIPLHGEGELRGLPREFHQALALAHLLDALRRPGPSGEALRTWYGDQALASPETARWVYRVVGSLRNADLEKLDVYELVAFCSRVEPWCAFASGLVNDRSRNSVLVNPPKDGSARST
ncbi:MAG TPA: hypothetical protein VGG63_09615 [Steroidobacteraceae bacterium]|jgi:hypothetical protein